MAQEPKPNLMPVPIWRCKNKECKAFIREEMASSPSPDCPLCNGPMIKSLKHLPELVNKYKTPKKEKTELQ